VGYLVAILGWRLPVMRSLYRQPHPKAVVDAMGIELHLPGVGVRRFAWDEIARLRTRRNGPADLVGVDGAVLAKVPNALIASGRPNLARSVVAVRPDRYVRDRGWFGRATGGFSRAPAPDGHLDERHR